MKKRFPWLLLAGIGAYLVLRRLGLRSGATDEEVDASLPGDEVIPHPLIETTHAITINAQPSEVWKWLVQAGYRPSGRAGWYTDSWVNDLVEGFFLKFTVPPEKHHERPGARSANEILPQYQSTKVGDIIPDGPPDSAYFEVKEVIPERAWVLYSDTHMQYITPNFLRGTSLQSYGEFTWVFVLDPLGEGGTRLILRTRANMGPHYLRYISPPIYYLAEAIFPRLTLRGIKERAESMARNNLRG